MSKESKKHTVQGVFWPLPRFGIHQGFKVNAEGELVLKTRCIDDAHRAGVNAGTFLSEALVLPTFEFISKVGGRICDICDDIPDFDLLLGLEDMYAAYRRFGNSSEHASVVAVFNPTSRGGLPMGKRTAYGQLVFPGTILQSSRSSLGCDAAVMRRTNRSFRGRLYDTRPWRREHRGQ